MNAAEPFDCTACGRGIGVRANHIIVHDDTVICVGCANKTTTHTALFPDCDKTWHSIVHHQPLYGSRAQVRRWLEGDQEL